MMLQAHLGNVVRAVTAVAALTCAANASAAASALAIDSRIVWTPSAAADKDRASCIAAGSPKAYAACQMLAMKANGASPRALAFARALTAARGYFGYATRVVPSRYGPVAVVATLGSGISTYGSSYFVTPNLRFIDTGDTTNDAGLGLMRNAVYRALRAVHPQATVWGQSGGAVEVRRPGGGQRFVTVRPIVDGCHACRLLGAAQVGYDFDRYGHYVGAVLLNVRTGKDAWFKPRLLSSAAGAVAVPTDFSAPRVSRPVAVSEAPARSEAATWADYRYADDGFAISSPAALTAQVLRYSAFGGPIVLNWYNARMGDFGVGVSVFDWPSDADDVPQILERLAATEPGTIEAGVLASRTPIELEGSQGLDILVEGRTRRMRERMFVAGRRVYDLKSTAPSGTPFWSETDRFFGSFHILSR